jgi:long-chain acyl-CoA synthetase
VVQAFGSTVTAAELAAHCARNLARFKCPSEIEFAETMPHSAIGKVRKSMLRDLEPGAVTDPGASTAPTTAPAASTAPTTSAPAAGE